MRRVWVVPGTIFLVRLDTGCYCLGVCARGPDRRGYFLAYFFRTLYESIPDVREVKVPPPSETVRVAIVTSVGIEDCRWPVLGQLPDFDAAAWPMPIFHQEWPPGAVSVVTLADDQSYDEIDRQVGSQRDKETRPPYTFMGMFPMEYDLGVALGEIEPLAPRAAGMTWKSPGKLRRIAYGIGSFQNEPAMDWADRVLPRIRSLEPLVEAIDRVGGRAADPEVCCVAVAAAEVLAALRGRPEVRNVDLLRDSVHYWLWHFGQQVGRADADVDRRTIQALETILTASGLQELYVGAEGWSEPGWKKDIKRLIKAHSAKPRAFSKVRPVFERYVPKILVQTGTWFAFPLETRTYGLGLIARYRDWISLGYFFGTRFETLPTEEDIRELKPDQAVHVEMFVPDEIKRGDWPVICVDVDFDPDRWPVPLFLSVEPRADGEVIMGYFLERYDLFGVRPPAEFILLVQDNGLHPLARLQPDGSHARERVSEALEGRKRPRMVPFKYRNAERKTIRHVIELDTREKAVAACRELHYKGFDVEVEYSASSEVYYSRVSHVLLAGLDTLPLATDLASRVAEALGGKYLGNEVVDGALV